MQRISQHFSWWGGLAIQNVLKLQHGRCLLCLDAATGNSGSLRLAIYARCFALAQLGEILPEGFH